jgi:hypothetical protein
MIKSDYTQPQYVARMTFENLSKAGLNTEEISYSLDVPLSFVKHHIARIERHNEARNKFLSTGILPGPDLCRRPGVFTISQR